MIDALPATDALYPLLRIWIRIPMPFFVALLVLIPFAWLSGRINSDEHPRTALILFALGVAVSIIAAREVRAAGYPYWPYGDPETQQQATEWRPTESTDPDEAVRFANEQHREYPIQVVCRGAEYADRSPLNALNRLMAQCTSTNSPSGHDGVFQECVDDPIIRIGRLLFSDEHYFICKT